MFMKCREYRSGLMELARGGDLESAERQSLLLHLDRCAECARLLDEQRTLQTGLDSLAAEALPVDVTIESRVLAEFDRSAALRKRTRPSARRWVFAAALAASIFLGAVWILRPSPVHPVAAASSSESPFLTIPYTIPLAPEERAEVVRMRIPVTVLLAAGFHVEAADPSTSIDADVLVSQDGRARAIRPLTVSIPD